MSLKCVFDFENPDSTKDLNDRFKDLFGVGFFHGGTITPVAGQLKVTVDPSKAMSYDGMVVIEDETIQLQLVAGVKNYICLLAVYNANQKADLNWMVLSELDYANSPLYKYLIVKGVVNIPLDSTEVTPASISYTKAHVISKLDRNPFRGNITTLNDLPVVDNRFGDWVTITNGTGDTPNIYVYNGKAYQNVTQSGTLMAELLLHRQNLFTDEAHLTNDQAAALTGTSGNKPSSLNPYIDNEDKRIPTQNENDALASQPRTTLDSSVEEVGALNKYMTEGRVIAAPSEIIMPSTNTVVEITLQDGPVWVGVGGLLEALSYFAVYSSDKNHRKEYLNSNGKTPVLKSIYKDAALTKLLDPTVDTVLSGQSQPSGFYVKGSLFLNFDVFIDQSAMVCFYKKTRLGDLPPDAFFRRNPVATMIGKEFVGGLLSQHFPLTATTTEITVDSQKWDFHQSNNVTDIKVYENGQPLIQDNDYFSPITIVTGVNDKIDYIDSNNTTKFVSISPNTYSTVTSLASLALDIQNKLNAAGSDLFKVTFSNWSFTIENTTAKDQSKTFKLLKMTGMNASQNIFKDIGYLDSTDYTGLDTYTSSWIDRGYVGYSKTSSTTIKLMRPGRRNGVITVEKLFR